MTSELCVTMRRLELVIFGLLCLLGGLVITGCGGDDDSDRREPAGESTQHERSAVDPIPGETAGLGSPADYVSRLEREACRPLAADLDEYADASAAAPPSDADRLAFLTDALAQFNRGAAAIGRPPAGSGDLDRALELLAEAESVARAGAGAEPGGPAWEDFQTIQSELMVAAGSGPGGGLAEGECSVVTTVVVGSIANALAGPAAA